jgi:cytochrome c peroxidase
MTSTKRVRLAGLLAASLVFGSMLAGCQPAAPPDSSTGGGSGAPSTAAPATAEGEGQAAAALPVVPVGLPEVPIPEDNPMTEAKVELGKLLYFDTRLSKDGTISCATCHDPQMAWAEDSATSTGIDGQVGGRNSPTVINAAYAPAQFWDGRAASLEEQALGPIENPIEMGHKLPDVVAAGTSCRTLSLR